MKKFYAMVKNRQQQQVIDVSSNYYPTSNTQNQDLVQSRQQFSEAQQPQVNSQLTTQVSQSNISDQENQDEIQPQTTSTTQGGDGLEFNLKLPSIFEEIQTIKESNIDSTKIKKQQNEDDFKMEDIPEFLGPQSILLESVNSLEEMKQTVKDIKKKEEEFIQVIKNLKQDKNIVTCSQSLELLINEFKKVNDNELALRDRIDELEQAKFKLQQENNSLKLEQSQDKDKIVDLKAELSYYIEENKRIQQLLDKVRKQGEENEDMGKEEKMKLLFDNQVYKNKIDSIKLESYELKKRVAELEKYQQLYENIQEKYTERENQDIEEKTQAKIKKQTELKSILGHMKGNPSLFAEETSVFLNLSDILKITCLSKTIQGTFYKHNSQLLHQNFSEKFVEMKDKIEQLDHKCYIQEYKIRRNEEKDHIRQMLTSESGDERLRHVIEKHVIKLQLNQSQPVSQQVEKSLKLVTNFVGSYFELLQAYQQKLKEQQIAEQLKQQQQQNQGGSGKSSLNQSIITTSADTEKQGYKLYNAGKKLVGAFSGFSFRKKQKQQQNISQQEVQQQSNNQEQTVDNNEQQIIEEEIKDDNKEDSQNIADQNEEPENHNKQPSIEAINTEDFQQDNNQAQVKEQIQENEENGKYAINNIDQKDNQQIKEDNHLEYEQQHEASLSEQNLISLNKQSQNDSQPPDNRSEADNKSLSSEQTTNTKNIQLQVETLKNIDEINSIDDMNDLLFRIGCFLINDKPKLSKWIAGLQQGFAEFFVLTKQLYNEQRELELLRDFFVVRVENLKLKMNELMNEKEDMAAIHSSDANIKEHLIQKMNDLDKQNVEKNTELLFEKRRVKELSEDLQSTEETKEKLKNEVQDFKEKTQREVKLLRQRVGSLTDENLAYKKAIDDMRMFFNKVSID